MALKLVEDKPLIWKDVGLTLEEGKKTQACPLFYRKAQWVINYRARVETRSKWQSNQRAKTIEK